MRLTLKIGDILDKFDYSPVNWEKTTTAQFW